MLRMTAKNQQSAIRNLKCHGSAIILAIVLTSLLAIIGILFLISSRVDSIATSSIADNKDLTLAVDTVIAQIAKVLAEDVNKGASDPNCYADYPDPCNYWLACLEPYYVATRNYRWRQVSDIYGFRYSVFQDTRANTLVDYNDDFKIFTAADADGDGIGDSIWVPVSGKTSNKGKQIYTAVRVIDNGAMLNVNTAFKFEPASSDGSKLSDINLMALSWRPNDVTSPYNPNSENALNQFRNNPAGSSNYDDKVTWHYIDPCYSPYTPFDISDELELRYRFLLNKPDITTRLESWGNQFIKYTHKYPFDNSSDNNEIDWFPSAYDDGSLTTAYAYRHIATTYNCERIIEPNGVKMFNLNSASIDSVLDVRDRIERAVVSSGLDTSIYDPNQIAINLIDFIDDNNDINYIPVNKMGTTYYYFGFERPNVYISEIAVSYKWDDSTSTLAESYAIELYNPYSGIDLIDNTEWKISITGQPDIPLTWTGNSKYHVIKNINPDSDIPINPINPSEYSEVVLNFAFSAGSRIALQRNVKNFGYIIIDEVEVPAEFVPVTTDSFVHTYTKQRDITPHKCIRRIWQTPTDPNLGRPKSFESSSPDLIQAFTENRPFTSIGDIGRLFYAPTYNSGGFGADFMVTVNKPEDLLIDVNNPAIGTFFKYLTVMDPCNHGPQTDSESRIKGRININTAPWFVIAQLPWVTNDLAQAIVAYRDKLAIPGGPDYYQGGDPDSRRIGMGVTYPVRGERGFITISELLNVTNASALSQYDIRKYAKDSADLTTLPDISFSDGAINDFEEQDVIFARISNLVTVRSDVFTAYILVRIGPNGPQKRVIAILDRSGVTPSGGKVKVIAVQPVPDPR